MIDLLIQIFLILIPPIFLLFLTIFINIFIPLISSFIYLWGFFSLFVSLFFNLIFSPYLFISNHQIISFLNLLYITFIPVDGVQEIGLIVSVYYKSLEGSNSLPIRPNLTSDDAQNRAIIEEKCCRICEMFRSNPYR